MCQNLGRTSNFLANVVENQAQNNKLSSWTILLACNNANVIDKNKWFLDNRCSNQMCGKKELFSEFDKFVKGEVKFRNNTVLLVFVKGKIPIRLKNGSNNFILMYFMFLGQIIIC